MAVFKAICNSARADAFVAQVIEVIKAWRSLNSDERRHARTRLEGEFADMWAYVQARAQDGVRSRACEIAEDAAGQVIDRLFSPKRGRR